MSNDDNWKPGPAIPKLPGQRKPTDLIQCEGCPDQVRADEITEYAGYRLCGDCQLTTAERLDRNLTRFLAYATA